MYYCCSFRKRQQICFHCITFCRVALVRVIISHCKWCQSKEKDQGSIRARLFTTSPFSARERKCERSEGVESASEASKKKFFSIPPPFNQDFLLRCHQFSRDPISAFNDRIKIRENRGL